MAELDTKAFKRQQKNEMRRTQQQKLKLAFQQELELASKEQSHIVSIENEKQADMKLKHIMQAQYSQMIKNSEFIKQRGKCYRFDLFSL